jgi:hypothetical protein
LGVLAIIAPRRSTLLLIYAARNGFERASRWEQQFASHPSGRVRALVFDKDIPGIWLSIAKAFAASQSLNGFTFVLL